MSRIRFRDSGNLRSMPDALWNASFMKACRGQSVERLPIWLMRQAGRYMSEYRAVRERLSFLELCHSPEVAAEVTVYACNRLDVDAAIIFADILLILDALGLDLTFGKGDGPRFTNPIRQPADLARLGDPLRAAEKCSYVAEAIAITRRDLPPEIPLIGFCGAPFTLASYAVEGAGSRQFSLTRSFMYTHEDAWNSLLNHLVLSLVPYCTAQVEAGAQALQIFDSWVGVLTVKDYERYVLPHMRHLLNALPSGVPIILFGTGTGHLLDVMATTGCDVLGVDTHTDLLEVHKRLGQTVALQGNIDPALLLAPKELLAERVSDYLESVGDIPGLIVNLGHGIYKETDPEQVIALVEQIHAYQPKV